MNGDMLLFQIQFLPTEIWIEIFKYSQNLRALALTCKQFRLIRDQHFVKIIFQKDLKKYYAKPLHRPPQVRIILSTVFNPRNYDDLMENVKQLCKNNARKNAIVLEQYTTKCFYTYKDYKRHFHRSSKLFNYIIKHFYDIGEFAKKAIPRSFVEMHKHCPSTSYCLQGEVIKYRGCFYSSGVIFKIKNL